MRDTGSAMPLRLSHRHGSSLGDCQPSLRVTVTHQASDLLRRWAQFRGRVLGCSQTVLSWTGRTLVGWSRPRPDWMAQAPWRRHPHPRGRPAAHGRGMMRGCIAPPSSLGRCGGPCGSGCSIRAPPVRAAPQPSPGDAGPLGRVPRSRSSPEERAPVVVLPQVLPITKPWPSLGLVVESRTSRLGCRCHSRRTRTAGRKGRYSVEPRLLITQRPPDCETRVRTDPDGCAGRCGAGVLAEYATRQNPLSRWQAGLDGGGGSRREDGTCDDIVGAVLVAPLMAVSAPQPGLHSAHPAGG